MKTTKSDIVKEFAVDTFIGNTHVKISDEYRRNQTETEKRETHDSLGRIALRLLSELENINSDYIAI